MKIIRKFANLLTLVFLVGTVLLSVVAAFVAGGAWAGLAIFAIWMIAFFGGEE